MAESCTGGLLGGRLTDVPGSSDVFMGGVIAYDNAVKQSLLGVTEALLAAARCGERSGGRGPWPRASASDWHLASAIGVTGIAGPGGGTPEKPVGTVWWPSPGLGETIAHRADLPREPVRGPGEGGPVCPVPCCCAG